MITRRPIDSVIAASVAATAAGAAASPSRSSTAAPPPGIPPAPQAGAPLGDRAVVVAVDQIGGRSRARPSLWPWGRCESAHDEIHELARHDDLLDDLLALEVRLHLGGRAAERLELLGAASARRLTRSRTLPLIWQTSS